MSTQNDAFEQMDWARGTSPNMAAQVERELRYGVPVGIRSNTEIVPRPAEGKHVRWSMRVYPGGAGQWLLMIKDQTDAGRHRKCADCPFELGIGCWTRLTECAACYA